MASYMRWLAEERGLRFADYEALRRWSIDDLSAFWRSIWDYFEVVGEGEPAEVLAEAKMPGARWFPGVEVNYAENVLRGDAEDVVIVALSQTRAQIEMTRGELRDAVARAAAGLRRLGVGPGDTVAGYLPNIPEAVIALLATASIGAVWAVCAPEFGIQSVLDRFQQIEPKVLIAVRGYRYGAKDIDRRADVEMLRAGLPSLIATVEVPYLYPAEEKTLTWDDLLSEAASPDYKRVPFDHPLWILFSSGTTGLPKAIVHGHGGIVIEQLKLQALHNDLGPGDRYFGYSTTSWVMWNLLLSVLLTGAAIVLADGNPAYPDSSELWRIAAHVKATALSCGAAFLMQCRRQGQTPGQSFDLSALRFMAAAGSPLPADGFRWVYDNIRRDLYLTSGSGGTDVCTAFVGGCRLLPVHAGEIACRILGVAAEGLDGDGNPVIGEPGELVISKPMPTMPIGFWGDDDGSRYREAYFTMYPGRWRHGDWVIFNERGGCVITGRSDGTLNRGGVRLGTAEFYAALADIDEVKDSLVVHLEDGEGGPGQLVLCVELSPGARLDQSLHDRISAQLTRGLSPRHRPDRIVEVPGIPYNLTGKKLEVPVKRLLQGARRSDVVSEGAVRNPEVLDAFESLAAQSSQP